MFNQNNFIFLDFIVYVFSNSIFKILIGKFDFSVGLLYIPKMLGGKMKVRDPKMSVIFLSGFLCDRL